MRYFVARWYENIDEQRSVYEIHKHVRRRFHADLVPKQPVRKEVYYLLGPDTYRQKESFYDTGRNTQN